MWRMFQPDHCFMEHYIMKTVIDNVLGDKNLDFLSKNYTEYNSNLVTSIEIVLNNNPCTNYTHSPQQYFIEFACYIGSVIALWFGISVKLLYLTEKCFLVKILLKWDNQNQMKKDRKKVPFKEILKLD